MYRIGKIWFQVEETVDKQFYTEIHHDRLFTLLSKVAD